VQVNRFILLCVDTDLDSYKEIKYTVVHNDALAVNLQHQSHQPQALVRACVINFIASARKCLLSQPMTLSLKVQPFVAWRKRSCQYRACQQVTGVKVRHFCFFRVNHIVVSPRRALHVAIRSHRATLRLMDRMISNRPMNQNCIVSWHDPAFASWLLDQGFWLCLSVFYRLAIPI
jgi:hypothetical protein